MDLNTFHGSDNVQVGTGAAIASALASDSSNVYVVTKWTGHLANQFQPEAGGGYAPTPDSIEDVIYGMLKLGVAKTSAVPESARNFAISTPTLPPVSIVPYNGAAYSRKSFTVNMYKLSTESVEFKASEI